MRDFLHSIDRPDLIQGNDFGRQASMDTKDPPVNQGCNGEVIKDLAASFPDIGIPILLLAFVIESVHLSNLPTFMISPYEGNFVGISSHLHEQVVGERLLGLVHQ